ncbi:MAG: serine/threonine-protein kinase, partial [Acidobacteriota bacterium]
MRDEFKASQDLPENSPDVEGSGRSADRVADADSPTRVQPQVPTGLRGEAATRVLPETPPPAAAYPQRTPGTPQTPGGKTDPIVRMGQFGKYKIVGKIGSGGFGKVYLGHDPLLGRDVAVKTCTSDDERLHRRFLHEAKIAAGLQHPNIVTVYDFGYEHDTPYMVQEYLSGEDLSQKIQRRDLPFQQRVHYLLAIARGLAHAHDHHVLHRDIKPGNIRVLDDGQVRILDFGIARLLDQTTAFTTDGVAMGTVGYLAPEMLNSDDVDARSDIFSFGVLAYELLSDERPFTGDTFVRVSYRLLHEEPTPLESHVPSCPPALAALVRRCLRKQPGERYASFHDIIAGLTGLVEETPPPGFATPSSGVSVPISSPTSAGVDPAGFSAAGTGAPNAAPSPAADATAATVLMPTPSGGTA